MEHDLKSRWRSCWKKLKGAEENVRSIQENNDKLKKQIKILKEIIVEFEMSQIHWSGRYSIQGNSDKQKEHEKILLERLEIVISNQLEEVENVKTATNISRTIR